MPTSPLPPLSEALRYCGRRLLADLEHGHTGAAHALTPVTGELLRWWFCRHTGHASTSRFYAGQREAILHTVLAHEVFASDDPERLRQLACDAWPVAPHKLETGYGTDFMAYALRMTPGTGLRWVVQALLLWQWLNAYAAHQLGQHDPRFDHRFLLLTTQPEVTERMLTGLLGRADAQGHRDPNTSSLMRHAHLFLPPQHRAPVREWLRTCIDAHRHSRDAVSEVGLVVHHETSTKGGEPHAILSLATGIGSGLFATGRSRQRPIDASPAATRLLWVDIVPSDAVNTQTPRAIPAALAECSAAEAIRNGMAKACVLDNQLAPGPAPHHRHRPHHHARPVLRRIHRQLLQIGLLQLQHRKQGFAALDPVRRPCMRVLCEEPRLAAIARRVLQRQGQAFDVQEVQFDTLPSTRLLPDPDVCVVVVLREREPRMQHNAIAVLAAGMPLQWREPELAEFHRSTVNTIERGRAPQHAIDVLCVVEAPQHHSLYAAAIAGGWMARGGLPLAPVGDLTWAEPRHAAAFELHLPAVQITDAAAATAFAAQTTPSPSSAPAYTAAVCMTTRQLVRARDSLPTAKSCRTRAGWPAHDHGLLRGLIEAAEADAGVMTYWLAGDWSVAFGTTCALARSVLSGIDIVVRTHDAMLLTRIASRDSAFQGRNREQQALDQWCREVRKLPAPARFGLRWHAVQLPEPLFWREKRAGTPLSDLLLALAGTTRLYASTATIPAVSIEALTTPVRDSQ